MRKIDTSPRQQIEYWIKDVCDHRGWEISQWAQMAGVSPQTIHRFRRGKHKTISRDNLAKLYEASTRPI